MAARTTTQLQLSAHRIGTRRLERALRCGQVAGDRAPGWAGLGLGCLASVIVVAGAVVLAVLRPQPGLGDAPILLDRASGALYVRVGDTVHPVFNLASARLITGAADPRPVSGTEIGRARRGPPLGIPGAPGALGTALPPTQTWSLCDGPAGTTLIAGADPPQSARIDADEAVPVGSDSAAAYLLLRGRRIPVNPADSMLESPVPRRVSALLLAAIPEAPPAKPADVLGRVATLPAAAVTLCAHWRADDPVGVTLSAGVGLPLPAGAAPTVLAQADGSGPALDAVYLPPGRSGYVRAAGASGHGAGYLITETGVRFTVDDAAAARSLGLPDTPDGVPWPMLAGLPAGPRLSREQALLAHDVVLPPPGR
ncbi:type VII secretion protein EccB [Mycolicibacter kumamotonensis]|jgi:hypothetical protein|uniref:Type VII secretion protein EccB n=1 Tax=Mycolicibacter kumamotonensis TaxID=354243 RepID=A0A1X0ED21_9MYCO|nr:type VII secretion protein EccB [Mycolicibacter kumamotonensis]ORA81890.1 type VII secretion protein EccB [Mycolicibacter kumamotonensis]